MPGLSFNPYCGTCGGLNPRGFCNYTACLYHMTHTTTLPVTVKEKQPYIEPKMDIFDVPDDVEEILIKTKEKTMKYVSDGDGWIFQEVSV